jgi:hypothetical protein
MAKKNADTDPSCPNKATISLDRGETHSSLPGESLSNPYRSMNPAIVRKLYDRTDDLEQKALMWKALKEWSRQFSDSFRPYPYEVYFLDIADRVANRFAEVAYPQRNLFYYQEAETTQHPSFDSTGFIPGWLESQSGDSTDLPVSAKEPFTVPVEPKSENPSWAEGTLANPTEGPTKERVRMSFFDKFVWGADDSVDNYLKSASSDDKKTIKLADLQDFTKIGENLLVHKSERDLWAMETDENGNIVISRLFKNEVL